MLLESEGAAPHTLVLEFKENLEERIHKKVKK